MTPIRILVVALVTGAASLALAQTTPAKPAAPAASKPVDCAKTRHAHVAEKGMPRPKSAECDPGPAKSDGKSDKKGHDHGKVHKQQ